MNAPFVETLGESRIYRDYSHAWQATTGMPLQFLPADAWNYPANHSLKRASVCALLSGHSGACSVCLQSRARLLRSAAERPCTRTCGFGLCETAVPVRLGRETIGFLLTGQVLREAPNERDFEEFKAVVRRSGARLDPENLREAYFQTPVVGPNVQREIGRAHV